MNEPTHKDRTEVLAWLGYVVASPIAVLGMVLLLLGACTPLDLCPDLQCEYGYAETTGAETAPSPGDAPGDGGKGDDSKGDKGRDKGKDGDDD